MKLTVSEPRVIVRGDTMEDVGWGPWQYPMLYQKDDGTLLTSCASGADSYTSYGKEIHWYSSADRGMTWKPETPAVKVYAGTLLPDGSRLYTESRSAVPVARELLPKEIAKHPVHGDVLLLREIDDSLTPKDWVYRLREPDGSLKTFRWSIADWPNYALNWKEGSLITPWPCGRQRVAPDGSVWQTHYGILPDPVTGGYSPYYTAYYLRSADRGETWEIRSRINYRPDVSEFAGAFTQAEGWCEADLFFPPDGSMVTILRSGSVTPSYIARSVDGGRSWSEPVKFDTCGVWPTAVTLGCGVTIAGYGRPGFFVRASLDPAGMRWEAPVELLPARDRNDEANVRHPVFDDAWAFGTCSYCDLLPLSDRECLVAYSDFYYPDPNGPKRKTILVRTLTVED